MSPQRQEIKGRCNPRVDWFLRANKPSTYTKRTQLGPFGTWSIALTIRYEIVCISTVLSTKTKNEYVSIFISLPFVNGDCILEYTRQSIKGLCRRGVIIMSRKEWLNIL